MKVRFLDFRMEQKPNADYADLYIFDEIGERKDWWTGDLVGFGPKKLIEALDEVTADIIHVHINSNGGDVFEGIAVYNLLKNSGKTIHTYVEGIAASIASVIAMAGETVNMGKTSMLMIHNCYTFAIGNSKELRKIADDMDVIMESIRKAYLDHVSISEDELKELLDSESYLTSDKCLEMGFCDAITDVKAEEKDEPSEDDKDEEDTSEEDDEKIENKGKQANVDMRNVQTHWFFS